MVAAMAALLLPVIGQSAVRPDELDSIQSPAHEEDDDNSLLQVLHNKEKLQVGKLNPIPSMGMIKVHKCGSSTLQTIVMSLAITRNMSVMFPIPEDEPYLGWPSHFPGKQNLHKIGLPRHQYQIINHHAVFNERTWRGYLEEKPDPVFVTLLREPVSQAISAYNQWDTHHGTKNDDWESHLNWLENLPMEVEQTKDMARYRNPIAWDMGWYEHVGWTAEYDYDKAMVDEWISTLEGNFNQMGSHILQEYYDEGLVLLKKRLKVDIKEVSYIHKNEASSHVEPTPMQHDRLKKLNPVDHALFEHFNKTFTELWLRDEQENMELLAQLKQANTDYENFCARQKSEEGEEKGFCPLWLTGCVRGCSKIDIYYDQLVKEVGGCVPPACTEAGA